MEKMVYQKEICAKVLAWGAYKGYEYLIVSRGTHPCAYVSVPEWNTFFGTVEDDDMDILDVHGGVTYSKETVSTDFGFFKGAGWWIGWDYAHLGDYYGFTSTLEGKKWTTEEIMGDVKTAIENLKMFEIKEVKNLCS